MFKRMSLFAFIFTMVIVIPAAAQVPSYVPTDGLVGWWPFNGNANDESGNGNDGVVNGATLTEDRFGNMNSSFLFNESSIQVLDASSINSALSTQLTLNAWVTLEGFPSGFAPIISKDGPVFHQYELFMEPSSIGFWSTDIYDNVFTETFELENWYMVTVTVSSTDIIYYIDGNLIASNQVSNINMIGSDAPLEFGADSPNGVQYHDGKIDDIAIYNRALSEQEIQNLYTGTTPPPCVSLPSNLQQGLVGYWPFCGNANDESGNGNDGVVNGATLTEDRFGNANAAYGFDGVGDKITFDSSFIFHQEGDKSISLWFNSDTISLPYYSLLFSKTLPGDFERFNFFVQPETIGDATFRLVLDYREANINLHSLNETAYDQFSSNTWNNIVITRSNSFYSLYINGILHSIVQDSAPILPANLGWQIGANTMETNDFAGSLDDIGIWNRALTPEEVQELYTLDACTFTVYDTVTVYETVYDTVYTYETIYDTVTTYITVTDTLLIDITFTGFEGQPSWLNTVTVFPNPASDHITIDYGNFALMAGYNTIITDAAGATVYSSSVNSQQVEIDINAWGATGVYYMMIYDLNGELVAVRQIVLE